MNGRAHRSPPPLDQYLHSLLVVAEIQNGTILSYIRFESWTWRSAYQFVRSSWSARQNERIARGDLENRNGMTAGARLSSVVFLALVSLSPCLAQRLEDDKDDFTGLLESPSRRPRALAFPKDSQLLVRTKTVVKIDED